MASVGYKVSGKKMESRFGMSHKAMRAMNKYMAPFQEPGPRNHGLSKRLAKKCQHENMVDDSYGGPESGCVAAHCTRCGYSFRHIMY